MLLLGMRLLQTRRDRRTRVTARIHDMLAVVVLRLVQQRLDTRLGVAPGTRIQRLLLGPDNRLGVGVQVEILTQLFPGERVQLFNAGDGDVVDVVVGAVLVQGGVDLPRAEDDAVNLVMRLDRAGLVRRVGDDPLEL